MHYWQHEPAPVDQTMPHEPRPGIRCCQVRRGTMSLPVLPTLPGCSADHCCSSVVIYMMLCQMFANKVISDGHSFKDNRCSILNNSDLDH